ncbi:MAG: hypothetical protein WB630_16680 [Candidatus Acidiferrales bacterium]
MSLIAQSVRGSFDERIDQQIRFRVSCCQSVRAPPAPTSQETLEPIVIRHFLFLTINTLSRLSDNVNT